MTRSFRCCALVVLLLAATAAACAPSRTTPPEPRGSVALRRALPGLKSGEIVYQAPDGTIHAVRVDGSRDRRVGLAPPDFTYPDGERRPGLIADWLPSRALVACSVDDSGAGFEEEGDYPIYVADLLTSRITTLAPTTGTTTTSTRGWRSDELRIRFSYDGTRLLYFSSWDYLFYSADLATRRARELGGSGMGSFAPRSYVEAMWPQEGWSGAEIQSASPDGRYLVTSRTRGGFLYDRDERDYVVAHLPKEVGGLIHTSFSSDSAYLVGEELVYPSDEDWGPRLTKNGRIWVIRLHDGSVKRVATGTAPEIVP